MVIVSLFSSVVDDVFLSFFLSHFLYFHAMVDFLFLLHILLRSDWNVFLAGFWLLLWTELCYCYELIMLWLSYFVCHSFFFLRCVRNFMSLFISIYLARTKKQRNQRSGSEKNWIQFNASESDFWGRVSM